MLEHAACIPARGGGGVLFADAVASILVMLYMRTAGRGYVYIYV